MYTLYNEFLTTGSLHHELPDGGANGLPKHCVLRNISMMKLIPDDKDQLYLIGLAAATSATFLPEHGNRTLEFLIDHNPSDRTTVLGSTQPITPISTRNIP